MTPIEKVKTFITAYLYDDEDGKTAELLRELEGMLIVPVEATREMLNAAVDVDTYKLGDISPLGFRISPQQLFEKCYRAMIAPYLPKETK